MIDENQNGSEAGRNLKTGTIPGRVLEPTQKPSDFPSGQLTDEEILILFSKYRKEISQLKQKIEDLETQLQTVKRYQQNGWDV